MGLFKIIPHDLWLGLCHRIRGAPLPLFGDELVNKDYADSLTIGGGSSPWTTTGAIIHPVTLTNSVAIGSVVSDASSIFDITSTTLGMLIPRMTTAQRPASPATSLLIFNITIGRFEYYTGTQWASIASASVGGTSLHTIFAAETAGAILNLIGSTNAAGQGIIRVGTNTAGTGNAELQVYSPTGDQSNMNFIVGGVNKGFFSAKTADFDIGRGLTPHIRLQTSSPTIPGTVFVNKNVAFEAAINVSVGSVVTSATDPRFRVVGTDKASIPAPVMTTAQRDAIASPTAGQQVFNTDMNTLNVYDASRTAWFQVGEVSFSYGLDSVKVADTYLNVPGSPTPSSDAGYAMRRDGTIVGAAIRIGSGALIRDFEILEGGSVVSTLSTIASGKVVSNTLNLAFSSTTDLQVRAVGQAGAKSEAMTAVIYVQWRA